MGRLDHRIRNPERIDRPHGKDYIFGVTWTTEQTREAARRRLMKDQERSRELEKRRREARAHAEDLARQIGEHDATVQRIWGFGSVFDTRLPYRASSDIDLAVEGGTTLAWKMSQRTPWDVDWVELSEQPDSFAAPIRETGALLYERQ